MNTEGLSADYVYPLTGIYIETGRYNKIPRDNILCKNCSPKKIEDEVHFLLTCPKYTPMGENWLKDINS